MEKKIEYILSYSVLCLCERGHGFNIIEKIFETEKEAKELQQKLSKFIFLQEREMTDFIKSIDEVKFLQDSCHSNDSCIWFVGDIEKITKEILK